MNPPSTDRRCATEPMDDLIRIAERIPSLDGRQAGVLLRRVARNAPGDTSIVEVGSWLGAGTAQLALGLRAREHADVRLHCFDRWTAQLGEVRKAARQGVRLKLFQDTLPYVRRTLEQFEVPLELHQGDVMRARWDGGPISVYVDDCCKQLPLFCHSLATFGPAWIPGETIVLLMDFSMDHQTFQRRFIAAAGRCFEPIELLDEAASRTPLAMFRYKNSLGTREWALVARGIRANPRRGETRARSSSIAARHPERAAFHRQDRPYRSDE